MSTSLLVAYIYIIHYTKSNIFVVGHIQYCDKTLWFARNWKWWWWWWWSWWLWLSLSLLLLLLLLLLLRYDYLFHGVGIFYIIYVNPKSNPSSSMVNCSMGVGDIMSCTPQMNPNSGTGTGLLPSRNAMLNLVNTCSSAKNSLVFTLFCSWASHGVCAQY